MTHLNPRSKQAAQPSCHKSSSESPVQQVVKLRPTNLGHTSRHPMLWLGACTLVHCALAQHTHTGTPCTNSGCSHWCFMLWLRAHTLVPRVLAWSTHIGRHPVLQLRVYTGALWSSLGCTYETLCSGSGLTVGTGVSAWRMPCVACDRCSSPTSCMARCGSHASPLSPHRGLSDSLRGVLHLLWNPSVLPGDSPGPVHQ